MFINYNGSYGYAGELDIEDPGNCCIKAYGKEWSIYYLVIKTIRGVSHFFEYGPIYEDSDKFNDKTGFCAAYYSMNFKERAIQKAIYQFLNAKGRFIEEAEVDDTANAFDDFPDVIAKYQEIV